MGGSGVDELPTGTVIGYGGGVDEPPAFHVRTPWGWAMLRDNAPGWTPPDGFRVVLKP